MKFIMIKNDKVLFYGSIFERGSMKRNLHVELAEEALTISEAGKKDRAVQAHDKNFYQENLFKVWLINGALLQIIALS